MDVLYLVGAIALYYIYNKLLLLLLWIIGNNFMDDK